MTRRDPLPTANASRRRRNVLSLRCRELRRRVARGFLRCHEAVRAMDGEPGASREGFTASSGHLRNPRTTRPAVTRTVDGRCDSYAAWWCAGPESSTAGQRDVSASVELKPHREVERVHVLRQRADRDEINAGLRDVAQRLERDAARRLELDRSMIVRAVQFDCRAQVVE